jgi:hypothetical protein
MSIKLRRNGAFAMSLVRLRRSRVCGTVRECHRLVDGVSERLVGAARQYGSQLPLLPKLLCNQSCGNKQMGHAQLAAGAIKTGRAAGEGVLGPARANRPRRHVATRRGAGNTYCKHGRIIGHAAMVRRSRAGRVWRCSRDGHSGTLQGHWQWVDCRQAAFVRFWVAGRLDSWSVLAFGGWDSGRTKFPNPRAPPMPSDADGGGGWERVRRHCRAGGSLEAAAHQTEQALT